MAWFFGTGKAFSRLEKMEHDLAMMRDQLGGIQEALDKIATQTDTTMSKSEDIASQVAKLTRLQYKSGQDVLARLDRIEDAVLAEQQRESDLAAAKEQAQLLAEQRDHLLGVLLKQLDELDLAAARLGEGEAWRTVLVRWAERILAACSRLGLREINLVGTSFDPALAESVGTVPRPPDRPPLAPYEVAEVVRRGFCDASGQVLRPARVITYAEAEKEYEPGEGRKEI